jgi:hypothetical protein
MPAIPESTKISLWTCPGLPYASYLLGSLLLAVVFSRASYSIGLR